jgi:hypothetical protein
VKPCLVGPVPLPGGFFNRLLIPTLVQTRCAPPRSGSESSGGSGSCNKITFTTGHTPRQLFSDNEVLAAASAGIITLTFTGEVYWCPIVGPGPNH